MNVEEMKEKLNQKNRVVVYAKIKQEYDLCEKAKEIYYKNKISENHNWIYTNLYVDYKNDKINTNNKQFEQMIKDCMLNKFDYIYVETIVDFAENDEELIKYIKLLTENNIKVLFYKEETFIEKLDKITKENLILVANLARNNYKERVEKETNIELKVKKQNEYRSPNYGYRINKKTGKIEIDPYEKEIVQVVFVKYIELKKAEDVRNYLTESNYIHKPNIAYSNTTNEWHTGSIRNILNNKSYTENYYMPRAPYLKDEYNLHKAIISKTIFDETRKVLKSCSKIDFAKSIDTTFEVKTRVLSRNVKCAYCGKNFAKDRKKSDSENWICCVNKYNKKNSDYCTESISFPIRIIEDAFTKCYEKLRKINYSEVLLYDYYEKRDFERMCKTEKYKRAKILSLINRLFELYVQGKISFENYDKQKSELENQLRQIENEKYFVDKNVYINRMQTLLQLKNELETMKPFMKKFDPKIYSKLVKYTVIGGKNGLTNEVTPSEKRKIIFIYKNNEGTNKQNISSDDLLINYSNIHKTNNIEVVHFKYIFFPFDGIELRAEEEELRSGTWCWLDVYFSIEKD